MATKVKLIADGVITPDQITLTTASTGTNTTAPATTAFVQQEISALVDSSPEALNTLNELAAALGDDANFSTTVTNSIATKAPLASPTFTGDATFDTSTLVIDSTNNRVGIGTDSPDEKLEIAGSGTQRIQITETGSAAEIQLAQTNFGFGGLSAISPSGNNEIVFNVTSSGTTSEIMRLDSSGNVGIGTTSPNAALEIKPAASSNYLQFNDSSDTEKFRIDSNFRWAWGTTTPTQAFDMRNTSGNAFFALDRSNGRVGIGTTSPASIFTLNGTDPLITFENGESPHWQVGFENTQSDRFVFYDNNASAYRLIIDSSGNVGIGSTNQQHRLSVRQSSGTDPQIHLETSAYGNEYGVKILAASTNEAATTSSFYNLHKTTASVNGRSDVQQHLSFVGSSAASDYQYWSTGGTERMRIDGNGYITTPAQPYIRCAGNFAGMAANQGTTADFSNWTNQLQRGITRSGAIFTVPKAGEYLITYSFYNWINNSGPGVSHSIFLKKNNVTVQETVNEFDFENDAYSYYDNHLQNSLILNMAAGDTFRFTTYADIYGGGVHTNMSAYLLG